MKKILLILSLAVLLSAQGEEPPAQPEEFFNVFEHSPEELTAVRLEEIIDAKKIKEQEDDFVRGDLNKDNMLSKDEYVRQMLNFEIGNKLTAEKITTKADVNKDGQIDKKELQMLQYFDHALYKKFKKWLKLPMGTDEFKQEVEEHYSEGMMGGMDGMEGMMGGMDGMPPMGGMPEGGMPQGEMPGDL